MPGKKRFASRADEAIKEKRAALAGAAARRLGAGSGNSPGSRFGGGGKVSGGGLGAASSLAADRVKRFQPLGGGSTVPTTGGTNTPGGPRVPGNLEVTKKLPPGLAKKQ